ncbi:MAG: single-stranded DNA-binding protein [Bacilli bacterium]|nr:single-stranded DNA-binding protein [Bacilli bacterium]
MINNVVLVGRLTRDPELKTTTSGTSICSFTVAVDNRQRNADGTRTASFIPCTAFQQSADNMSKFLKKGSLVGIVGRLNQRSYLNKDNIKVTVIEVLCDTVQFLEPKGEGRANENDNSGFESDVQASQDESKNLDALDLPDDDLPF